MIKYKTLTQEISIKDSIICDFCGKEYSLDITRFDKDSIEAQEFIHIHHEGGYGSIFGDALVGEMGSIIDLDICQHCFKDLIMDKVKK